jgi:RNA polymerase sigma-70 factor (ECF subfamily)
MSTQHLHDISDNELLEKFYSDYNNEWLGILFPRYTLLLFGVCMKYLKNGEDAKDAVQQIFLKAINELHKYKVTYFKSWIYMIAKNHCLMQLRDKNKIAVEINEHITATEEPAEINFHLERNDILNKMNIALQQLKKEQQQCLTLFYLEKQSYVEISNTTGYDMPQVKSYIQNGKRNLKLLVEKMVSDKK